PDNDGVWTTRNVVLGHRRLAIIDTSESGNQPMVDSSDRFVIVFNGEFFNFKEHRQKLESEGHRFQSSTDTEVLLKLYALEGPSCLNKVNGFFALAIYDKIENTLFLARDRFGIKPLLIYEDHDNLMFSSEMKSLIAGEIKKNIDHVSLVNYLQLNYIPGLQTIFENVSRLEPGTWLLVKPGDKVFRQHGRYYEMPLPDHPFSDDGFEAAAIKLRELLEDSVRLRLVSDVPLGAFLSGGIDSSVVVSLASKMVPKLNTFSIGFKDEPYYDETAYARMVAKHCGTEHIEFRLTTDDLFGQLQRVLDYLDEPFADSSALAVQILCNQTTKHVKVALSGDGADEMLGGYNKHRAEYWFKSRPLATRLLKLASPALSAFKGGRGNSVSNIIRKIHRFSEGASMNNRDRYWRWCGHASEKDVLRLIDFDANDKVYQDRKNTLLRPLGDGSRMEQIFRMDMGMVLPGDMLVKVDLMSMANSLEVRVPFLDYRVVDHIMRLPQNYRISSAKGKLALREAFKHDLPSEIFERAKHGFEVPLLKWFRKDLRSMIENDLLSDEFISDQGIFHLDAIKEIRNQLFSEKPGDIESRVWGLIVFQYWWKRYM
ncbi:MAG: asparagine synthase (glutamine-hydrolyzing), partial [Bacteroidota bacterium]